MPQKMETLLKRIEKLPKAQKAIIYEFKEFKEQSDCSERNVVNLLAILELFARHMKQKSICQAGKDDVLSFLAPREKSRDEDPDEKWKTTWNYYRSHIATFYNWYTNKDKGIDQDDWEMPDFIRTIKPKKTKRLSPYRPNDVWLEEEILCVVKYCGNLRDKLVITLMWDMAGRNHEIARLKIKDVVFKEKYAIISIPWNSKTGERTNPAILSFPYLRDYINAHPFSYDPNSFLVLSTLSDKPIIADTLYNIMTRLKVRVKKMFDDGNIEGQDVNIIRNLLKKPWNPYLVGRHSSITEKTDILLDHQLTSFAGWTVNTKRRATYSHRSGKQTRTPLLEHHGIETKEQRKPARKECPSCQYINVAEATVCAKCNFVLNISGLSTVTNQERQEETKLRNEIAELVKVNKKSIEKIEDQDKKLADMEEKMYQFLKMLPEAKTTAPKPIIS